MSLTAFADKAAAGGGAAAAAAMLGQALPRLRGAAYYAGWRADMEAALARMGADSAVHMDMTAEEWRATARAVEQWAGEDQRGALARLGLVAARPASSMAASVATGSSSGGVDTTALLQQSLPLSSATLSKEDTEARTAVRRLVEASQRAYGALFSTLQEDLRMQVSQGGEVPHGFARGLWLWLERKFQSTEEDSVGALLAQWVALAQQDGESFDAYRARVNHVKTLLDLAKEPQSARMVVYTLLDKLTPPYKAAVLALKASDRLKDPAKIDWDGVAAFVNAQEREALRIDAVAAGSASAAAAFAGAKAHGGSYSGNQGGSSAGAKHYADKRGSRGDHKNHKGGKPRSTECFRCGQQGHIAATCTAPP
jgi:hypothetical protein